MEQDPVRGSCWNQGGYSVVWTKGKKVVEVVRSGFWIHFEGKVNSIC